jgi:hypothetical protein
MRPNVTRCSYAPYGTLGIVRKRVMCRHLGIHGARLPRVTNAKS